MRVLVVGCGRLGAEVAELLARPSGNGPGHEVIGMSRSQRALPEGARWIRGDVGSPTTLPIPAGLDAIVYAVAASARNDDAYRSAYPEGVRNVARALGTNGTLGLRFVFVSSTGVYGETDGRTVDEASPTRPSSFTGTRLLEAEQVVEAGPWRGTSLRLGGIYGPDRTDLIEAVRAGRATYERSGPGWSNRIHQTDAARAVVHVLGLEPPPACLNVVDAEPTPRRDVLMWLAARLQAPPPTASDSPARGGDKRVVGAALLATGFELTYPTFREGYSLLLES